MFCNILLPQPFDNCFTYKYSKNQKIKKGSIVIAPFGNKADQLGLVYNISDKIPKESMKYKIREIKHVFEDIFLDENIIKFINWINNYTLAPKGLILKLFILNYKIINYKFEDTIVQLSKLKKISLNMQQQKAYKIINKSLTNKFHPIVLEGVTGSGKTEVYFEAIEKILFQKKQALIMLPEISLTPQLEERFKNRFGFYPDVWHSKVTEKKKKQIWHKCYRKISNIVIGARSSLFLPFNNLGLIVVDEEHDLSYKQEDNIRYQARDLAIVKAKINKIPIILSSATPSVETHHNINKKKFTHLFLPNQFSGVQLPSIKLIDMKKQKLEKNHWISTTVINSLNQCLNKKEQVLFFLNRRGYSPLVVCEKCGFRYKCQNCSSWLVMHKKDQRMMCHHCGYKISTFRKCPKCINENSLKLIGPGVERLAEELESTFPKFSIGIMSSDNANTSKKITKIIKDFENKKIDILVATQIMAKGYHFPNLSMVAIIDADLGLMGGELRAIERTYNLMQQVSGRAGRSYKRGEVLIQTYYPDHPVINSFTNRDRDQFIKRTIEERKQFKIPPFSFLNSIIISSRSKSLVNNYALKLVQNTQSDNDIDVLGPVEAPLFLLRGRYRIRILLKGSSRKELNFFTKKMIEKTPPASNIRLTIDVDPYTFM